MVKLALRPDADGYSMAEGNDVIGTELEGGAGRYRRDKIGSTNRVSCTWTLNRDQYRYWRAFFHTATERGSLPFLCDLVGEDGTGPKEHTCRFVPGSVSLSRQVGLTYVMQATLEVEPLLHSEAVDTAVMALFATGTPDSFFGDLDHLVNISWPG